MNLSSQVGFGAAAIAITAVLGRIIWLRFQLPASDSKARSGFIFWKLCAFVAALALVCIVKAAGY